jgi:hypothetical protein
LLLRQLFGRQVPRHGGFALLRADGFDFLAAAGAFEVGETSLRIVKPLLGFPACRLFVFLFENEERRAGLDLRAPLDETPVQPSGRGRGDHHVFTLDVALPGRRRFLAAAGDERGDRQGKKAGRRALPTSR